MGKAQNELDSQTWITATVAGNLLALSAAGVTRLARIGHLPYEFAGKVRIYRASDVFALAKARRKAARAKAGGK